MKSIFPDIFLIGNKLATKNLTPGLSFFEEQLVLQKNQEFRLWDPSRSKLAAAIRKGLKSFPLKEKTKILYLGAANGYTASFISDVVGKEGIIYAIEFSPRAARDLIFLSEQRKNIVLLLEDARLPENFAQSVEKVDLIYCDVAQKDQAAILMKNADLFLKSAGHIMIAIKARSIDVTKKPSVIYAEQRAILEKKFDIIQQIDLSPFEKDHAFFVGRIK